MQSNDRIAVVTGAGSGVGRAVAHALADAGWTVAAVGRRREMLDETAVGDTRRIVQFTCDISDDSAVSALAEDVRAKLGVVGVLVNSAGINVRVRALADVSPADFDEVVRVNLNGTFYCVRAFLPAMRAAGDGTIVNIASDAGLFPMAVAGTAYVASKHGVVGFTHMINVEERANGIRACALCPGGINTPILDKRPSPPSSEARLKLLQPEDIAACVMMVVNLPPRAIVEEILIRPR